MTVIIFIIVLAVLIFVHEFGHFIAARSFGIRVDAFALGFGPKIFSWKRGETEYSPRAIPFGGYVKIFGENPDEENTHGPDKARSFVHKPRWQQAIVLAAGVLCNFIFAWVLYTSVLTLGVTTTPNAIAGYPEYFSNERIMIEYVAQDSPAAKAGIVEGDVINGYSSIGAVQQTIKNSAGKAFKFSYSSRGVEKTIDIQPVKNLDGDNYAIGISMVDVGDIRLPFYVSIWEGMKYTFQMTKNTAVGLFQFIVDIFRGAADYSQVSGIVGIAGVVGDAAGRGIISLILITAIISINLGVINLLPFPALDGGRIVVVGLEAIVRRRVSPKIINVVNTVGFVLLMLLMVLVTYKDIMKLLEK